MDVSNDKKKALILDWLLKNGTITLRINENQQIVVESTFVLRVAQAEENESTLSVLNEIQALLHS